MAMNVNKKHKEDSMQLFLITQYLEGFRVISLAAFGNKMLDSLDHGLIHHNGCWIFGLMHVFGL